MKFLTKSDALEFAAELALDGKLPSNQQVIAMLKAGVDYKQVHSILSEVFYDGEELEDADTE